MQLCICIEVVVWLCLVGLVHFSSGFVSFKPSKYSPLRNGFARTQLSMGGVEKDSTEDKSMVFVSIEKLKDAWLQKGGSESSFDEKSALLAFVSADDDDEGEIGLGYDQDDDEEGWENVDSGFLEEWVIEEGENVPEGSLEDEDEDDFDMLESIMEGKEVDTSFSPILTKSQIEQGEATALLMGMKGMKSAKASVSTKSSAATIPSDNSIGKLGSVQAAGVSQKQQKEQESQGKSVGIDLGTTYSSVSVVEGGVPRIVPVDGARIVPSVVAYLRSGVEVGERARRQQVVNPLNTFASIKRVIGQRKSDIDSGSNNRKNKDTNKDLSGGIAGEGDETDVDEDLRKRGPEVLLACPTLDRSVSPVEVSAEIIRNLLRAAESHLGTGEGSVTKAVITVPAYFLPDQCAATEEAGYAAGLTKVRLLREPEAAALAYGLGQAEREIVLVFDLGGGTFDVSVLEVGGGYVEVIATSGDNQLGGDDFDAALVDMLLDEVVLDLQQNWGYSRAQARAAARSIRQGGERRMAAGSARTEDGPDNGPNDYVIAYQRLLEAARQAKIELSRCSSTIVELPVLLADLASAFGTEGGVSGVLSGGGSGASGASNALSPLAYSVKVTVTRRRFEALPAVKELLNRLLKPVREVAIMAGVNLLGESGQAGVQEVMELSESESESEEGSYNDDNDDNDDSDEKMSASLAEAVGMGEGGVLSASAMKTLRDSGRQKAKERKKQQGSTRKELRRIQKEQRDPSISVFPGGQQLSEVVLVGGSTRLPCVRQLVRTITGISPRIFGAGATMEPPPGSGKGSYRPSSQGQVVNPDEAVSLGAAVLAGILDGDITNMSVMSAWQAAMYRAFYEQKKGSMGLSQRARRRLEEGEGGEDGVSLSASVDDARDAAWALSEEDGKGEGKIEGQAHVSQAQRKAEKKVAKREREKRKKRRNREKLESKKEVSAADERDGQGGSGEEEIVTYAGEETADSSVEVDVEGEGGKNVKRTSGVFKLLKRRRSSSTAQE